MCTWSGWYHLRLILNQEKPCIVPTHKRHTVVLVWDTTVGVWSCSIRTHSHHSQLIITRTTLIEDLLTAFHYQQHHTTWQRGGERKRERGRAKEGREEGGRPLGAGGVVYEVLGGCVERKKSSSVSNLVSKVLRELPQHCRICKKLTDSINQQPRTVQNTYILMKGEGARVDSPMCRHTMAASAGMERSAYANVIRLDRGL